MHYLRVTPVGYSLVGFFLVQDLRGLFSDETMQSLTALISFFLQGTALEEELSALSPTIITERKSLLTSNVRTPDTYISRIIFKDEKHCLPSKIMTKTRFQLLPCVI